IKPETKAEAAPSPAPDTQSAVRPVSETPMPEMAKANPPASTPAPESMPGDNGAAVSAVRASEGLHVTFSFASETPAALFRRADTVWMVFDTTKPLDVTPIRSNGGSVIPGG